MKNQILIVDDTPENIDVLGGMLAEKYDVCVAIDGRQALEIVSGAGQSPDLILLDVMMPEMSGFDVCRRLKDDPHTRDIPVIFVTAKQEAEDEIQGISLGAVDFIRKPLNEAIVLARVRSHLALKNYRDLLARTASQQRLFFRQLFMKSPFGILLADREGRPVDVNPHFEHLFGYSLEDLSQDSMGALLVPEELREEHETSLIKNLKGESVCMQTRRRTRQGDLVDVSVTSYPLSGEPSSEKIFYIFEDISRRRQLEEDLRRQALYDPLTGVSNRTLLTERLDRSIERLRRDPQSRFAVLLIDLDRFKEVNDSLGHPAGDKVLIAVADGLQTTLRSMDTLARLGGDEFVVLLDRVESLSQVEQIAARIQTVLRAPVLLDGIEVRIGASMGIVFEETAARTPEELLRDADMAMYGAKESGRDCFRHYHKNMHKLALEKIKLENDLRMALERKQLTLFYQPIWSLADNRLCGFEALLRWEHPDYGLLPPLKFIPLAEESGLIVPIGTWVMDEACRQLALWHLRKPWGQDLYMNVNVSVSQFLQPDFVASVEALMTKHRIAPQYLNLEITESLLLKYSQEVMREIAALKKRGLSIVIDDFGTGYSSLAYINRFPVDRLKIDRSFVRGLITKKESAEVVRSIIAMSRSLGIGVVAEGVESQDQLDALRELGCDKVQGFLLAEPMPQEQASAYLDTCLAVPLEGTCSSAATGAARSHPG
jgi:Amt family ammonium transporter